MDLRDLIVDLVEIILFVNVMDSNLERRVSILLC